MSDVAPVRARLREEARVLEQRSRAAVGALPPALTTFIGRRAELDELEHLAASSRLLTLVGGGGAGKTRLAVELAGRLRAQHAQGVWFVDLSSVTDPERVEPTVARAVGVLDDRQDAPLDTVVARVLDEPGLLVVDNCEHLVETCAAVVVTLLTRCAQLRVLATSREPLDVAGETTWRVPALSLPPADLIDVAALAGSEAADLFCNRAEQARPGWACTDADAGAVASICRALEGMPLALELAAARVRVLSVADIASGLCDQLAMLTGGGRLAAQRRRTLRASLDWSHDLLTDPERILFRRLAAFAGTFDVGAATAVGASPADLMEHQVFDQLCLLVDKSLVNAAPGQDGGTRFRLPETVRQYAAQRLTAAEECAVVAAAHRAYYVALAETLRDRAHGAGTQPTLAMLGAELSNLQVAFDGSLSTGEVEHALRIATACYPLWRMGGRRAEGSAWLDRALARDVTDARIRLRALIARNRLAGAGGICAAEADRVDEAIALAREVGDRSLLARALHGGTAYLARGLHALQELLNESVQVADEVGDLEATLDAEMWLAVTTTFLHPGLAVELLDGIAARTGERSSYHSLAAVGWSGVARLLCGDADGARHTLAAAIAPEAAVAQVMHGYLLAATGWAHALGGRSADATEYLRRAIRFSASSGDRVFDAMVGLAGGMAALADGDPSGAEAAFAAGLRGWAAAPGLADLFGGPLAEAVFALGRTETARELAEAGLAGLGGDLPWQEAWLRQAKARVALADGMPGRAADQAHAALTLRQTIGDVGGIADTLEFLAGLAAADTPVDAARLFGAADALRAGVGSTRFAVYAGVGPTIVALRSALGESTFGDAWAQGRALSADEAVAYAARGRGERGRPATGWDALTPSERAVVELVADGLRNSEIATKLFVSPRTVQTHLRHAYAKLGIAGRVALAQEVTRHQDGETP